MLQLLRKIRQKNLAQNKVGKYLLYAIGEILLVVIGILIAVTINNNNEQQKLDGQLQVYRTSLIAELEQDIENLNELKRSLTRKQKTIVNYVDYYNTPEPNKKLLLQKLDSTNYTKDAFYTSIYTIQDLIATGNLSLFPKEEKTAILRLKNIQERILFYETYTIENIGLYDLELKKNTDLMHFYAYSKKQHQSIANWKENLDSEQFLILNNILAETLKLYEFQEFFYTSIQDETQSLLDLLTKDHPKDMP